MKLELRGGRSLFLAESGPERELVRHVLQDRVSLKCEHVRVAENKENVSGSWHRGFSAVPYVRKEVTERSEKQVKAHCSLFIVDLGLYTDSLEEGDFACRPSELMTLEDRLWFLECLNEHVFSKGVALVDLKPELWVDYLGRLYGSRYGGPDGAEEAEAWREGLEEFTAQAGSSEEDGAFVGAGEP